MSRYSTQDKATAALARARKAYNTNITDYDRLKGQITELQVQVSELQAELSLVNTQLKRLPGDWKGEISDCNSLEVLAGIYRVTYATNAPIDYPTAQIGADLIVFSAAEPTSQLQIFREHWNSGVWFRNVLLHHMYFSDWVKI